MQFPSQKSSFKRSHSTTNSFGHYDMRDALYPRRLTMVMWDNAFLLRHGKNGSFENYDKVLDEVLERGYNTLRLDPMPQWIDLTKPETILEWPDPQMPFMPWNWNSAVKGSVGSWLIEFMEKVQKRRLNYTLSAWWMMDENKGPKVLRHPQNHKEGAEMWCVMLQEWKKRFGFEGLVYVDLANEIPFFFPGFLDRMKQEIGCDWWMGPSFTPEQIEFIAKELNEAMALLFKEFPELRFTASIHGDLRWLDIPLEFDCLDVHFYSEADPRWNKRTRFSEFIPKLFTETSWQSEFSERCMKTNHSVAPMLRASQRDKLAQFAAWSEKSGMPLTTSESWASWYYIDSSNLDWAWLLEWAEWSVEDAIDHRMWGWTPHNYCQPQFENWKDVRWHQRLTDKFLRS